MYRRIVYRQTMQRTSCNHIYASHFLRTGREENGGSATTIKWSRCDEVFQTFTQRQPRISSARSSVSELSVFHPKFLQWLNEKMNKWMIEQCRDVRRCHAVSLVCLVLYQHTMVKLNWVTSELHQLIASSEQNQKYSLITFTFKLFILFPTMITGIIEYSRCETSPFFTNWFYHPICL